MGRNWEEWGKTGRNKEEWDKIGLGYLSFVPC